MVKNLKTTRVLVIDTAIALLFAVALVSANIYLTNHINNSLKEISDNRELKLNLTLEMAQIARLRSSIMLKMYAEEDPWRIDEDFTRFHKIALDFIQLRDTFLQQGLTHTEKKLFDEVLALIKTTEPLQNDITERIQSGQMAGVHEDIARKDIPLEIELLGVFEELSREIIKNSYQEQLNEKEQFTKALIVVSVISVLVLLTIIFMMSRSLKKIRDIEMELIVEASNQSWAATHDPLTNVYNRRWFKHKLEEILKQDKAGSAVHVLIYIDLDDFKKINDNYGHVAGDYYLQKFCRSTEACIRQSDILARMGGDEFAVLLEYCNLDTASKIANEILETIRNLQVEYETKKLSSHCSIGVYEFMSDDVGFEVLIKQVDALCYLAKKQGKDRIVQRSLKDREISG